MVAPIWGALAQLRAPPVGLMSPWRVGPACQSAVSALLVADCEREAASHVRHHWVAPAGVSAARADSSHCECGDGKNYNWPDKWKKIVFKVSFSTILRNT